MQHESIGERSAVPALLRGIRDDIVNYFLPELTSGEAREHAEFARLVLERHATELDLQEQLEEMFFAEFASLLAAIERAFADNGCAAPTADLAQRKSDRLVGLRERLAATIPDLTRLAELGVSQATLSASLQAEILALEARLLQTINDAQRVHAYRARNKGSIEKQDMTIDALSAYLRRRYPGLSGDPILKMTVLPGGRSKSTVFVTLKPNAELPTEIVIRQDIPGGPVDTRHGTTSVRNEYPVLCALTGKCLPIAHPLLLEANESECGHPFMAVQRLYGEAPGTFFGLFSPRDPDVQAAMRDLARVMARLHSVDVTQLGLPDDLALAPEQLLQQEIDYRWNKWRRDTVEPSPIVEYALSQIQEACKPGLVGGPTLVHADIAPHNVLAHDGKITGLLDWEFVHAGDPAQDLAYCRASVEQSIPWAEFMDIYIEAGGKPIDERRLIVFGLLGLVRNCTFSATVARLHFNEATHDFTAGASGYFSIPIMETQIITLLKKLNAAR